METSKAASRDSIDEKASSFDFLLIAPTGLSNWGAYDELTWPETVGKVPPLHVCDRVPFELIRDSPDESQTGINVRVFPALLQDRREVLTATNTSGNPNAWSRV